MPNTNQPTPVFSASRETLLRILETLPDAFLVVDDGATVVYANVRAQALAGATHEEIVGTSLWRAAPHLVSTELYQAFQRARHTREPADVAYRSSVTNRWLQVSLSPTEECFALVFQEALEP